MRYEMTPEISLSHRRSSFAAFISTGRGSLPFGTGYVYLPGQQGEFGSERVRTFSPRAMRVRARVPPTRPVAPVTNIIMTHSDCSGGADLVESRRKLLAEV